MDFINKTPTDKRYSGYGGLLLVTIRTAWYDFYVNQQWQLIVLRYLGAVRDSSYLYCSL
jgi:hypothetical protein